MDTTKSDSSVNKDAKGKNSAISFIEARKREMKENKYRQRFDALCDDISQNLVDTQIRKQKIDQSQRTLVYWPTIRSDGSTDWAILPRLGSMDAEVSNSPRAAEPISFSKVLIAASAIAANVPDGQTFSTNKIKARAYKELLKRSWTVPEMNGYNTLDTSTQNMLTYGWAAWRIFPKQEIVARTIKGKKTKKIVFDDIYREPLDPRRTWIGLSYKPTNNDNRPEVLYEIDITKDEYAKLKKRSGKRAKKGDETAGVSQEAQTEDSQKVTTHVTLSFYENPRDNRYIIASESVVFYDGEMPNEEIYGSVVIGNCFLKEHNDPYGVGVYELMRGNEKIYNYINSLNTEQVAAEIEPLIFVTGITGNGDLRYKRGSSQMNVLPAGAKVEKFNTTGNTTLGLNFADKQKQDIEDNTGINNIVAGSGSETTLGATVILKEAALNRLIKPRNSIKQMIENDACIFFSWLEQDQMHPREFVFASLEEVQDFKAANPTYQVDTNMVEDYYEKEANETLEDERAEETENDADEFGIPKSYRVYASERVPMTFDYNKTKLEESEYENQDVMEFGDAKYSIAKSSVLQGVSDLDADDKIGYDKVLFIVDPNSMLIPSAEIQKQTSMQLYPVIQNALLTIYGLARQDPDQAVAQLKSFKTFLETQKENIYNYIPKEQYDKIITKQMAPTPAQMAMDALQGQMEGATGPDGAPVAQPQAPQEMSPNQSPMSAAVDASMGRAAKQLG